MSDACECDKPSTNKSKWIEKIPFGKKKKERAELPLSTQSSSDCPLCIQKGNLPSDKCKIDVYEEKQRIRSEEARKDPHYIENNPEDRRPDCDCTQCRRARGEDPLTVELLPMETQVTLQSSLEDTILMCVVL